MEPRPFQRKNFERFKNLEQWAIFSEQGTGKSKVALDIISNRWLKRTVTGVIILSSPKGVHAQWIEEQLPKHLWRSVQADTYIWDGKKPPRWIGVSSNKLQIVSGNIDMLKSKKGFDLLRMFATAHGARLMILVDESDSIKNVSAQRSKKLRELALWTKQRAIMTGTPIAKDLTDEWAQFYFLNPDIIGHKYLTSFRAQYCIMGGFENREVTGHRNIERFKEIVAPFIFRATKADLDLPPKVYDEVVFDLSKQQRAMIKDIRDQFFTELGNGSAVSVKNGATALLRVQQISNGFAVNEEGRIFRLAENPRLDALLRLRKDITDKVIIWCRFREDVKILSEHLPNAVTIYGEDDAAERMAAKNAFTHGHANELIATPGAAGKGVDGLQRVCSTAIYYSNSYNAIDRWQSEDRIDRIGMKGTSTYFDLIGRGSIDRAVLSNLKQKKHISSLALGDIQRIMEEL
jgi:SNF2 family DNA or RNA helicase